MSARPIPTPGAQPHTTSTRAAVDDWRARAACLAEDPELFWPTGETSLEDRMQIATAKSVCLRCPVMDTCLQWALETGQEAGVWGAHTEAERRSMKRRNARIQRADPAATRTSRADAGKADPTARPICGTHSGYEAHTRKHERQCDTCRAWRARGKRAEEAA